MDWKIVCGRSSWRIRGFDHGGGVILVLPRVAKLLGDDVRGGVW